MVGGSCDIMGEFPFFTSHYPEKFSGHRRCRIEDILSLACHMTSRDFVVRESRGIIGEFPSSYVITLQSLVIIGLVEEEILSFHFVT